jgi:hypothetical protein
MVVSFVEEQKGKNNAYEIGTKERERERRNDTHQQVGGQERRCRRLGDRDAHLEAAAIAALVAPANGEVARVGVGVGLEAALLGFDEIDGGVADFGWGADGFGGATLDVGGAGAVALLGR